MGMGGVAIVWMSISAGTTTSDHPGGQFILASISSLLDRFLTEYLRANPECAGSGTP